MYNINLHRKLLWGSVLGATALGVACQPPDAPKVVPIEDASTDATPLAVAPTPADALKPTFDADQQKAAALNPSDLKFTISVSGGKTRPAWRRNRDSTLGLGTIARRTLIFIIRTF